jgi:EF-P beta-lysylation protein EpmB
VLYENLLAYFMLSIKTLPHTIANHWQMELSHAITDLPTLLAAVGLTPEQLPALDPMPQPFALRVPRGFVARMRRGDPNDPLLLQVLPLAAELLPILNFSNDPLQEAQITPVPGLLHKYHGRVLLIMTGACAIHCRYCFRRHFPYADNNPGQQGWQQAITYIANDPQITEVILSGGDPLMLKDAPLHALIQQLAAVKHVKRLRIHSRLPIVLPQRITPALVAALTSSRLQPVMVVHSNHANELDDTVKTAIAHLRAAQIPVLNQAVLLKNVNDSTVALAALSEALFAAGVLPYYLNLLDPVNGAAHFAVAEETAKELVRELMRILPGYLVPRLVKEQAGAAMKLPIAVF